MTTEELQIWKDAENDILDAWSLTQKLNEEVPNPELYAETIARLKQMLICLEQWKAKASVK